MLKEKVKTFRDLKVWRKAHELVLEIYKITKTFPEEEKFGVVSQLRRAAISIATNIVEGHKRRTKKEFLYFLNLAEASLEETKYLIFLSEALGYLSQPNGLLLNRCCEEIGRMLYAFQKNLLPQPVSLTA